MRRSSSRLAKVAVLVGALSLPSVALARPGGGHAFGSGGGGASGSSGSGGGGIGHTGTSDASFAPSTLSGGATLALVVIALGLVGVFAVVSGATPADDVTEKKRAPAQRRPARVASARARLRDLERYDPSFSTAVFEDFSYALYTELALAAGRAELTKLRPYVSDEAMATLSGRPLAGVSTVLVGALTIRDVSNLDGVSDKVSVEIEIEANLARRDPETGDERAVYVVERWVLRRAKTARSRQPDRARILACPSCSAPLEALLAGKCRYCGEEVSTGAFDWVVCSVRVIHERERGPVLAGHSAADTSETPSIVDPDARARFYESVGDSAAYDALAARITHTFDTFHEAWSAQNLEPMRHLTTDPLFESQAYWIAEYEKQGLCNVTEDAAIARIELARVTSDPYFDAVTVRIHAHAKDYTKDARTGEVVSGEPTSAKRYSEYWTFLRKRATNAPRSQSECPRCGAPRSNEIGGHCSHCGAKVGNRALDWVLSRIEQDEAYNG